MSLWIQLFAEGLRNEGGLAFDNNGVLHGVENGADNLNRADLGGDIHDLNPTEEFNRFDGPLGQHFGYPYCFSTYNLPGYAPGTQFAWPDFMNDGVHNDDWCKNVNNVSTKFGLNVDNIVIHIIIVTLLGHDRIIPNFENDANSVKN